MDLPLGKKVEQIRDPRILFASTLFLLRKAILSIVTYVDNELPLVTLMDAIYCWFYPLKVIRLGEANKMIKIDMKHEYLVALFLPGRPESPKHI